ncbi:response regulator transcription factor [Paucibacter sp. R3-3]|uniref:Response regulator transcription factor n=1 Tax=Roseateles agri TaxID=3098619 RepID=A0ABU5DLU7_9BURK|nr:response regulator transcription factor [Paucibacter sp. R3-3]MDY0746688.1 response regulator transcription factor [Paucibacter sp. R3-3]
MKLRVLIVDDDPAVREPFAAAVEASDDMQVIGLAATLAEGRHLLHNARPDVMLVDLGLPDGDGSELIKEAQRALPDCEAMVVTVFGDEAHVLAAIEAGATGYLLKDATPAEIVDQLRVLKAGGSPINAVIARQMLRRSAAWAQAERSSQESADGNAADDAGLLSPREREVLQLCAKGYSYEEIAPLLNVSRHTVTSFVKRIYRKLQVHSRTEAVYEARRMGLLRD